ERRLDASVAGTDHDDVIVVAGTHGEERKSKIGASHGRWADFTFYPTSVFAAADRRSLQSGFMRVTPTDCIRWPAGPARHRRSILMASVRSGAVTLKGNPVDLVGTELRPGDKAPDFRLQSTTLDDVTLADSNGRTRILATIPSLDTS